VMVGLRLACRVQGVGGGVGVPLCPPAPPAPPQAVQGGIGPPRAPRRARSPWLSLDALRLRLSRRCSQRSSEMIQPLPAPMASAFDDGGRRREALPSPPLPPHSPGLKYISRLMEAARRGRRRRPRPLPDAAAPRGEKAAVLVRRRAMRARARGRARGQLVRQLATSRC